MTKSKNLIENVFLVHMHIHFVRGVCDWLRGEEGRANHHFVLAVSKLEGAKLEGFGCTCDPPHSLFESTTGYTGANCPLHRTLKATGTEL